jgi:ribosome-associated protein
MCADRMEISSRSSYMPAIRDVGIGGEVIRLAQLLKLAGITRSGGEAKALLDAGVRVNGVAEARRGRQLRPGDVVEACGEQVRVVHAARDR